MKRKLAIVLVMAVILSLLIVVPVSAKQPLRGWVDLDWNEGFQDEATPCHDIPWAGNIEIDGVLYGWTFGGGLPMGIGRSIHWGTSEWMIYESSFGFDGGVFEECEAEIAVWGYKTNVTAANVRSSLNGTVEWVNPNGHFDEMWTGRNMHMNTTYTTAIPDEYSGTFRMN